MFSLLLISQVMGDWPMWAGGPTHSAFQLMKGAMKTQPVVKWIAHLNAPVSRQFSAIGDVDGDGFAEVIACDKDGNICAINGTNGSIEWSTSIGPSTNAQSSPAIADVDGDKVMEIFVGSGNKIFYCLEGNTGNVIWEDTLNSWIPSSPAVADLDGDGIMEVIVGTGFQNLYCLNALDGTLKWLYTAGNEIQSSPALADIDGDSVLEVIYGNLDGNVYCLKGSTGEQLWKFSTSSSIQSSPVVVDVDGDNLLDVVIANNVGSTIYCINAQTGQQKWSYTASGNAYFVSSPTLADVDGDGTMETVISSFFGTKEIFCINNGGSLRWSFASSQSMLGTGSIADINGDGNLEFMTVSGDSLMCFQAIDGSVLWTQGFSSYNLESCVLTGDIDNDGCTEIIVGTQNDSSVYALDDPGDSSGCGPYYSGIYEYQNGANIGFRILGHDLCLFVPTHTWVSLDLYDASGRLVQEIYSGLLAPGTHIFNARVEARGVYFALLRCPGKAKTLKVVR